MTGAQSAAILPPELAILADNGSQRAELASLVRRARQLRVTPLRALLASRTIAATPYTAAVAEFWQAPVMIKPLPLDPATKTDALAAGFARLADGRWLISTDSPSLPALVSMAGAGFHRAIVLASPSTFRSRVRRALSAGIAREVSLGLADRQPQFSYRTGVALWQKAAGIGLMIGLLAVAAQPFGMLAQISLFGCSIMFLASIVIQLGLMLEPNARLEPPPPRLRDDELPFYGVLVPLHREVRKVPELINGLKRLAYPPEKLDIRFLVEASDPETYKALHAHGLPPWMQVVVVPPGHPKTKPRALNAGLIGLTTEFVVVYDAEDEPDPMQLRDAAAHFRQHDDNVVCLQGRLVIDNARDNRLTALFAMEYAGLFEVIKPGLARMGLPVPLGGTSNHFRRSALEALGGWDAWNVTEDADLGIRIARAGYLVADLPSSTYEEAPKSIAAWLPQRRRWLKGWLQTIITHSRSPWKTCRALGLTGSLVVATTIGGMIGGALGFPILTGVFIGKLLAIGSLGVGGLADRLLATLAILVFAGGFITMAAPIILGLKRLRMMEFAPAVFLLPLYNLLIFIAAWGALFELIRAPFQWNKTEHGFGTTSLRRKLNEEEA